MGRLCVACLSAKGSVMMYENGAFCWLESISLAYQKTHPGLSRERHIKWKNLVRLPSAVLAESFYSKRRQQRIHQLLRSQSVTKVLEKLARCAAGWEQTKSLCAGAQVWGSDGCLCTEEAPASCPVVVAFWAPRDDYWAGGGGDGTWTFVSMSSEQWHQIW